MSNISDDVRNTAPKLDTQLLRRQASKALELHLLGPYVIRGCSIEGLYMSYKVANVVTQLRPTLVLTEPRRYILWLGVWHLIVPDRYLVDSVSARDRVVEGRRVRNRKWCGGDSEQTRAGIFGNQACQALDAPHEHQM